MARVFSLLVHIEADLASSEGSLGVALELSDESFSQVVRGHWQRLVHSNLTLQSDRIKAESALLDIIVVQKIAIFSAPSSACSTHHANLSVAKVDMGSVRLVVFSEGGDELLVLGDGLD